MTSNEEKVRRFKVWEEAQREADVAKRVWGVSSPHNAKDAQERATTAMHHWMAVAF